ncbi:uncharacterized protein LOC132701989 [Cylas formicarius]|uniref:uncharacterized protein LOC132701989 n=1 Tax=Cylas formicarius TaxID=197179 RepID=UPI002958457B|nr:uncharacterized protein LOC132701989 [Cylas formicarius]
MARSKVNKLGDLLKQTLGRDVDVVRDETSLLTAPGEHYGSVMLALKVKIKRKSREEDLDLVAKLIPANEMLRVAFDIPVTFKKEVFAYTEMIPALVQLQKEHGVPESLYQDRLFPRCYGARLNLDENKNDVNEDAVLLFENLKVQGYFTEDRLVGFDEHATRVILKDLARFHAVPIALKLLKPAEFEEKVRPCTVFNKGLEQLPAEVGLAFHNSIMEGAKDIPDLEPYLQRLQRVVDDALVRPYVQRHSPNEPWGTVTHADFWVSNTMVLKDKSGRTVSNKIVDLQLMRYWSCCCDLVFFLFTSVVNDVLEERFEEFLKLYHETFLDTLRYFGVDMDLFGWDRFVAELDEVAPTEVYHVLVMLKPICTERGKVTNTAEEFQDSDWSRKDLLGPNHRRKLRDTVLGLVKRGWI